MDRIDLNMTFGKIDIDKLSQELVDNEQCIFVKTKITTT